MTQPPRKTLIPFGLESHQLAWARKLAFALEVSPSIALLRAFKAYVVLWQAGKLPPELRPEGMGPNPVGLPEMEHAEFSLWSRDDYPYSRKNVVMAKEAKSHE